ncbi:hypothetical protein ABK040_014432 [Willaertia magna]
MSHHQHQQEHSLRGIEYFLYHYVLHPYTRGVDEEKMKEKEHRFHDQYVNAVSGSVSGVITAVALAPLDVVKTRLMIQRIPHKAHYSHHHPEKQLYRGILPTMRQMVHTEGFSSLYKGLGTNLLGYVPNWAVYFTSYEYLKEVFAKPLANHESLNHMASSMLSGALTSIVTSPMWVIKTRMQTQVEKQYRNTFHAFREILKNEGIRGLYRGLIPSFFGLIHVGVQFPLYEYFKKSLRLKHNKESNSMLEIMIAGSVSKCIASVVAYPHEVLRSRFQDHAHGKDIQIGGNYEPYKGMRDAVKRIYTEEGIKGFYRGMGTNLVRVVPAAVLTLGSYEFCVKLLS